MSPAFASGAGVWAWRFWRQRRDDQQDDAEDERRDNLSKALDDRQQREIERLEKRNAMLEEQHAVDVKYLYSCQVHMNLFKQEVLFLRREIEQRRKAAGEQPVPWPDLPPLPQPDLNQ